MSISKRRSWGFQNTPNMWSLDDFGPSYCNLKKIKVSQNNFDWRLLFWNCYNPAQNNPHFASWGCFGILRTSSCWWALRFLELMHPGMRNWRKRECSSYWRLGVRVANWVRELIIGIETFRDGGKPKYAINRTILDKNSHKQLILGMYWQRGPWNTPKTVIITQEML